MMKSSNSVVNNTSLLLVVLLSVSSCINGFVLPSKHSSSTTSKIVLFDGDGTGGWGIGGAREVSPEEFARRGERRYFDGYQMSERTDFMNQIKQDQEELKKSELQELLGVAKIAGINVKDPKERLNKFNTDDFMDIDDDDLDLSI